MHTLVLHEYGGSVQEYIRQNDIDTVVVAYTSSMIGAHDDTQNNNYTIFDFH